MRITFESQDRSSFLLVNGRAYRGNVEVISNGATLTAVNVVSTEAYLRGVVGVEMGQRSRNEMAALEAQAIASRTYALKNRGRFRAAGYDLRAGVQGDSRKLPGACGPDSVGHDGRAGEVLLGGVDPESVTQSDDLDDQHHRHHQRDRPSQARLPAP